MEARIIIISSLWRGSQCRGSEVSLIGRAPLPTTVSPGRRRHLAVSGGTSSVLLHSLHVYSTEFLSAGGSVNKVYRWR